MTETYERVIARLASILASLHDIEPLVERLCEAGRQMLDGDGAAIVLTAPSDVRVITSSTDTTAATLEDLQDVVGQGPTVDALETQTVQVADFGAPDGTPWTLLDDRVDDAGFSGVLTAIPLVVEDQLIGVFSVHSRELRRAEPRIHRFLGAALAAALLEDPLSALGDAPGSDGWTTQAKVHQATGMVIAQVGVRPLDALALLRAQAFSTGATLLEVAEHVVDRQINFRNFSVEGD